ncbi:MAG TPA: lysophospholipid acyltransferase family protein [Rhizomicrobium sp.]
MSKADAQVLPLSSRLRYGLEAAGFFFLIGFFRVLGIDGASAVGGFLGREILYRTSLSVRARDNLRAAYPEKSDAEIETILREMWDNLGRTVGEYAHLEKITLHGPNPRIQLVGVEIGDAAMASGKGVMFISGHFANWETMPFAAHQHGYESGEVYRPVNNPYVGNWIVKQRIKCGPKEQISKGAQGVKRIFTFLRRGKAILLLVDQKTNEGVPAPFFGREAMTTPAPAALHLKLGAILLPASNERVGGARFRMTIHPPVEFEPTGNHDRDVLALTVKINAAIEECVRARPSQWLWLHRRWPQAKDKPTGRRSKIADQDLDGASVAVESEGSSFT